MYIESSLEYVIDRLFRCGVGDPGYKEQEVEELLQGMDYDSLLQAVRHEAKTVYTFATYGKPPQTFDYRGAELFGQRATLLYDDFDQSTAEAVLTTRSVELWLLEDMTVTAVASVSVVCEGGAYVAEYREDLGDPWASGMCLDLEELTDRLDKLCWPVHENEIPVYEL